MTFDEAVQYLLGLGHETLAVKLGLRQVARLLAALDSPQHAFPSVQIAGTNGKGSTAAMLDAACRAAGLRAGLYTSPHLVSITERVRIAGRDIDRRDFARQVARVREAAHTVRDERGALPSFFEQVTATALCAFRDASVELAILETGLGGRLDAVTAAGASTVAVTPIALDHQEYLGASLREIAAEKAAVIRAGSRAVVAPQEREASEVIEARCRECGVTPRRATTDIEVSGATRDGRLRATFRTDEDVYENVLLSLRGRHQLTNAATALALAEELRAQGFKQLTRAAIAAGLETAEHAGRLELVTRRGRPATTAPEVPPGAVTPGVPHSADAPGAPPDVSVTEGPRGSVTPEVTRGMAAPEVALGAVVSEILPGAVAPEVLLDGAHNPAGARALRDYLDEFARGREITLVFGAMRDKELAEIAALLFPAAARLILTRADSPRSAEPAALAALAAGTHERGRVLIAPSAAEALRAADDATPPGGLVCVTGSLYLVGEAKALLSAV